MVELQESQLAVPGLDGSGDLVVGRPVQLAGVRGQGEGEEEDGQHGVEGDRGQPGRAQSRSHEGGHHGPGQAQEAQGRPGRDAVGEEQVKLCTAEGQPAVNTQLSRGHREADGLAWDGVRRFLEAVGVLVCCCLTYKPAESQTGSKVEETPAAVEDRVTASVCLVFAFRLLLR